MKVVVIGAGGTIGKAVASALSGKHEVVHAFRHGPVQVDLEDGASITRLFATVKDVDAVACCAGNAAFGPLSKLTDAEFQLCLRSKLMGQVNLVRAAAGHLRDGGSITLTGGVLAHEPIPGGAAISMVNAALEGFVVGASLELSRGLRLNLVSPPWITETLKQMKMDNVPGAISAATCARAYLAAIEGKQKGEILDARRFA